MLQFSAISPHPPILIPTIGKDNINEIKNTQDALRSLEQELYSAKIETIIVISPHSSLIADDAFTINTNPKYKLAFKEFGDFSTEIELNADLELIHKIKSKFIDTDISIISTASEELDYGSGVPLFYLSQNLKNVKIITIGYSMLDYKTHFEFGKKLKNIIFDSNKRIAVIASGDLSHRLTKKAPAGYSERGKEFDEKLIKLLKKKDIDGILNMDKHLIEEAGECGLRSIIILLGILNNVNYNTEILSYESPFGVGYLVANMKLA